MMYSELETVFTEELYNLPPPLTIAVDRPWNSLSKEEVDFLSKIASSIKLSLNRVQIIDDQLLPFQLAEHKPDKMIGFGLALPGTALYEVVSQPPTKMVLADGLPLLMEDESLKKKLWTALQQLMAT